MQHVLNAGPGEPATQDASDDFDEADTASLRSLVSHWGNSVL